MQTWSEAFGGAGLAMRRGGARHRQRCHAGNVTACCYLGAFSLVSYWPSGLCPSDAVRPAFSLLTATCRAHRHFADAERGQHAFPQHSFVKVAAVGVLRSACLTASDQDSRRMTSVSPVCSIIAAAPVQTLQASLSHDFAFSQ